jgi:phage shock protein PspC (stress-responsive transcriptional regulator)
MASLRRSRRGLIGGVCSGLAEWLGWPPIVVRVIFVVGSVLPFVPGVVIYLFLWVLMPKAE